MKTLFTVILLGILSTTGGCAVDASTPIPTPVTSAPAPAPVPAGSLPSYNTRPAVPDAAGMTSTAVQLASRMKVGLNIGNTMEAMGGESGWGNPKITPEFIQAVKDNGFDAIRIPVSWNQYADAKTAKIDPAWLDRIRQVVQYCVDKDMIAIVNIHWDGGWLENNVTVDKQVANNARQKALWEQIATHLRDFDERLIFASANEPNVAAAAEMKVLLSYHQTFIDTVRATGGRNAYRALVVQGPDTDIDKTMKLWTTMPKDTVSNKLMAEVHFYSPFGFTLMTEDASWGKQFYYWGAANHSATDLARNPTWGEEDSVNQLFQSMKQQFVDKGIPLIIGEYAAMRRDNLPADAQALHLKSRDYYVQYVTRTAVAKGLVPFYWDIGGIINRRTNAVDDRETLAAIMKGAGKRSE